MDRRESIKSLMIGSLAGGMLLKSCAPENATKVEQSLWQYTYGRTPEEKEVDEKLLKNTFFKNEEMLLITTLANLILPPNENGTIQQARVPEFIEFIMKDIPEFQTQIRGGLTWLNRHSSSVYGKQFVSLTENDQKSILDKIAYPVPNKEEQIHQIKFFSLLRNLVMTGYFTSEVGVAEIGYVGNMPNVWDGVPEDVLDSVGMSYEPEWIDRCINQSKRNDKAEWDDEGNLLT